MLSSFTEVYGQLPVTRAFHPNLSRRKKKNNDKTPLQTLQADCVPPRGQRTWAAASRTTCLWSAEESLPVREAAVQAAWWEPSAPRWSPHTTGSPGDTQHTTL